MALPHETQPCEWRKAGYVLSTDRSRLDLDRTHRFLSEESYWAQGIRRDRIERSIECSIVFGLYFDDLQVGFARVVTDCTRIAYLLDVFIDRDHRGRGLGTWLADVIRSHPDLADVARWLLTTKDAHEVYERAGWVTLAQPDWLMEVVNTPQLARPAATTGPHV